MNKEFLNKIAEAAIIISVGILAIIAGTALIGFATNQVNIFTKKNEIEKINSNTEEIKKNLDPYEFKGNLKKTLIVQNFTNTALNGKPTNTSDIEILVNGSIKQGYLYVKASTNNQPIERNSVYMKLTSMLQNEYFESGGHIVDSRSLNVPQSPQFTELLYDLSDVKYISDGEYLKHLSPNIEVSSGNWLRLLNDGENDHVISFMSTQQKGTLLEISIYYQCSSGEQCQISTANK